MKYRLLFLSFLPCFFVFILFYGSTLFSDKSRQGQLLETYGSSALCQTHTQMQILLGNRLKNDVWMTEERLLQVSERLSEADLMQTAETINDFYAACQIPTFVIAVPHAMEFYADTLPEGLPAATQKEQMEYFYTTLDTQIQKINTESVLRTVTKDYIYYRTSPYWTSYGAYCVYQNAIQKMGFVPVSYDAYTISHVKNDYRGGLYRTCLYQKVSSDLIDIYKRENESSILCVETVDFKNQSQTTTSLYTEAALLTAEAYAVYPGYHAKFQRIQTNVENGKRLLLIKDDWANCMLPFLAQHYSEICCVSASAMEAVSEFVPDFMDFQQVLFLCSTDTYADTTLFDCLLSAQNETAAITAEGKEFSYDRPSYSHQLF